MLLKNLNNIKFALDQGATTINSTVYIKIYNQTLDLLHENRLPLMKQYLNETVLNENVFRYLTPSSDVSFNQLTKFINNIPGFPITNERIIKLVFSDNPYEIRKKQFINSFLEESYNKSKNINITLSHEVIEDEKNIMRNYY